MTATTPAGTSATMLSSKASKKSKSPFTIMSDAVITGSAATFQATSIAPSATAHPSQNTPQPTDTVPTQAARLRRPKHRRKTHNSTSAVEANTARKYSIVLRIRLRRTPQLRHSRRSRTWPARMMFEFHKPVNCTAERLLPEAPGSAVKAPAAWPTARQAGRRMILASSAE